MKDEPRITHVYLWQQGMVMVFDQYGQQMPDYQGPIEEVKAKIDAMYTGAWYHGNWITREVTETLAHAHTSVAPASNAQDADARDG